MQNILIVVDYQNDFADPNGKLYVPGAENIAENIQNMIDNPFFDRIVYTMDTHIAEEYEKSEEKLLFPEIHCEMGSNGWKLFKIQPRREEISEYMFQRFQEGEEISVINEEAMFTKNKFDIWEGNNEYEYWFKRRIPKDANIYICGVATNYCVYMNAIGYAQRGYKNVFIVENAIKGIDDETYSDRVEQMKSQFKFVSEVPNGF